MSGTICQSTERIDDKVVVVTGSNTGIGKETVEDLLKRGGKVYMTCRSLERCHLAAADIKSRVDVGEDRLIVMWLDLGSLKSIRRFVTQFKQFENHVDILINNAAVAWAPESKTEDGFESTFGINHLGHFLLTHLLMDLMIDPVRPCRIVNVSSNGHYYGTINFDDLMFAKKYHNFETYSQSKLANVLFTRELARRLDGYRWAFRSCRACILPDTVRMARDGSNQVPKLQPTAYIIMFVLTWPFFKEPWNGAQTTVCCAVDSNLASQSGKYYSECAEIEPSPEALNDDVALKLWNVSVDLVQLQPEEIHAQLR